MRTTARQTRDNQTITVDFQNEATNYFNHGKPPALPGDSQSLTVPGVCRSSSARFWVLIRRLVLPLLTALHHVRPLVVLLGELRHARRGKHCEMEDQQCPIWGE